MARRKRPTKRGDNAAIGLRQQQTAAPGRGLYSKIQTEKPAARTPERATYNDFQARVKAGKGAVRGVAADAMVRRTKQFERDNPERYEGFEQMSGARNMNPSQVSRAMGMRETEGGGNNAMQGTLFDDQRQLESPPRWEDMDERKQQQVLSAARDYGATPETMKKAYSSQLQRGLMRDPQHTSFYEATGQNEEGTDLPRERLLRSSRETGAPFELTAATNAITSPQTSFVTKTPDRTYYPNAETAEGAVNWSRSGQTGEDYQKTYGGDTGKTFPFQGYPSNFARAADVTTAVEKEGTPLREAWKPGGRAGAGAGDKVRAFHNAWVDPQSPEGQYFVSDTHSGAAGMAPHLAGSDKESQYLSVAGIHALHDKVARDVHDELGVGNTARGQSLQWNQEKAEKTEHDNTMHGESSVEAMTPAQPRNVNPQQIPGQMRF